MAAIGISEVAPELAARLKAAMVEVEALLNSHIQGDYPFAAQTSHHLIAAGGKRLRPLLTLICAEFGQNRGREIIKAAVVCELTHLGTLYHDDVMDEAPLRRGVESANNRWGNSVAILTGDYLFAKVSDLVADLGPEAVRLQARTFERLVIGQIMETQGAQSGEDPLDYYLRVVANKTGSLIASSARFGALLSGASSEIIETVTAFGEKIGVAFQLADDVLDIASASNESGKTPGADLKEGILTLVTLNVMKSTRKEDAELKKILKKPISDNKTLTQVLKTLRTHPAMDQSRAQLFQIAKDARAALGPLPASDATGALFSLCDALIDRST